MHPIVQSFFDHATSTVTHVVSAGPGSACAVIDSVLDYDPKSGRTATGSADAVIAHVRAQDLRVQWLLETHAHADHLSAAPYLAGQLGAPIGIGADIRTVQHAFANIFNTHPRTPEDGSQFDHLFSADETFTIGRLEARAMHVPGHTPADIAFQVGDAVFDYPPPGREARWESTVAEQRAHNIHLRDGVTEAQFVELRTRRDATLDMPTLILPAIQVNINAGRLPPPEENGVRYLKIPINAV
jgi:glyoxylase-like metal-dependent hydrolase (beta-lactamase superfamily II)